MLALPLAILRHRPLESCERPRIGFEFCIGQLQTLSTITNYIESTPCIHVSHISLSSSTATNELLQQKVPLALVLVSGHHSAVVVIG